MSATIDAEFLLKTDAPQWPAFTLIANTTPSSSVIQQLPGISSEFLISTRRNSATIARTICPQMVPESIGSVLLGREVEVTPSSSMKNTCPAEYT